jgi:hypothetical protein
MTHFSALFGINACNPGAAGQVTAALKNRGTVFLEKAWIRRGG